MIEELVVIRHLSKQFEPQAPFSLQSIDATIPKGKIVGLAGPDGAGKTTLIRLIAGLLLPTEGTITVDGYDTIAQAETIHTLIGYMPQRFGLYEDLTVMQNLTLYADLRGVVGKERKEIFEKLLNFTALKPFVDRLAKNLSGGMKQKLGLACALVKKPALLLLDEPSVGVDPISRRELWKMVKDLLDEGISVLWSTAYLDEAEKCDSVLLLNEGKLLYHGTPQEMTKRVVGRSFLITQMTRNRRQVLAEALKQPNVMDGIIQGSNVRIVVKKEMTPPITMDQLDAGPDAKLESTPPRFEDAFVDILGGGPGGYSELAEKTPPIPNKDEPVIEADNLVKKFGSFIAVDHVSFKVKSGEIFGLLGPNGAGKSTTFRMMCGLLKPTEGQSCVNGLDLQITSSQARAQLGYMAQKFSLYGNLSVLQNLHFFSGIYSMERKRQREAIDEMIHIFALQPYLDVSTEALPLGFKQRMALACSLMHRPQVLFLDEPTSGVDPITRREFWNHINGLVEKGVTIIVTTHFMDEAEYCDRIGLIYQSKLIEIGTPDDLKTEAITKENPSPTLEDAFILLIEKYNKNNSEVGIRNSENKQKK